MVLGRGTIVLAEVSPFRFQFVSYGTAALAALGTAASISTYA